MEFRGTTFSVIGGARSGIAVAKLLKAHGAAVLLSDKVPLETMQQAAAELDRLNIPYEFGGNSEEVLRADVLVVSPGVPEDAPIVKAARAKGKAVVGEIEVASLVCKGPIVAITGTNGKTTTTALVGRIFEDAKRPSVVAGNIGLAFSQLVEQITEQHTAILEVSSFQLDTIKTFRPRVSALLNITPDHLDRYEHSMDKYVASKCRVFENQRSGDTIVYNYDDDIVRTHVEARIHPEVKRLPFSTRKQPDEGAFLSGDSVVTRIGGNTTHIIKTADISIKGAHNLMNAMASTLVAQAMNIPTASLRATLKNFKGVEHRLEFVRELDGITYVNDSKATNVDSVWYALQSFERPIVLLLGGRDKGNDYSSLVPLVNKHVRSIVAVGESADKVLAAFADVKPAGKAMSMEEAVSLARHAAVRGDVVLLSPACASFDWFENYEHRGRVFKDIVMKL
ncbi:MAG: UDP-N-acetylmuramoyl-L-alanine--D-glutamate ligase [Bacteroidetes bacterium]|nr:UDP-N-acetylmuramoyl-L-alanine--D-glutamate ligase [Bacteroidota bacterium]MCW5894613.1 UDP-N-acetylmuramoyl-L-alanine--D-glutamate ligase [Bacteroidota bacterium]